MNNSYSFYKTFIEALDHAYKNEKDIAYVIFRGPKLATKPLLIDPQTFIDQIKDIEYNPDALTFYTITVYFIDGSWMRWRYSLVIERKRHSNQHWEMVYPPKIPNNDPIKNIKFIRRYMEEFK